MSNLTTIEKFKQSGKIKSLKHNAQVKESWNIFGGKGVLSSLLEFMGLDEKTQDKVKNNAGKSYTSLSKSPEMKKEMKKAKPETKNKFKNNFEYSAAEQVAKSEESVGKVEKVEKNLEMSEVDKRLNNIIKQSEDKFYKETLSWEQKYEVDGRKRMQKVAGCLVATKEYVGSVTAGIGGAILGNTVLSTPGAVAGGVSAMSAYNENFNNREAYKAENHFNALISKLESNDGNVVGKVLAKFEHNMDTRQDVEKLLAGEKDGIKLASMSMALQELKERGGIGGSIYAKKQLAVLNAKIHERILNLKDSKLDYKLNNKDELSLVSDSEDVKKAVTNCSDEILRDIKRQHRNNIYKSPLEGVKQVGRLIKRKGPVFAGMAALGIGFKLATGDLRAEDLQITWDHLVEGAQDRIKDTLEKTHHYDVNHADQFWNEIPGEIRDGFADPNSKGALHIDTEEVRDYIGYRESLTARNLSVDVTVENNAHHLGELYKLDNHVASGDTNAHPMVEDLINVQDKYQHMDVASACGLKDYEIKELLKNISTEDESNLRAIFESHDIEFDSDKMQEFVKYLKDDPDELFGVLEGKDSTKFDDVYVEYFRAKYNALHGIKQTAHVESHVYASHAPEQDTLIKTAYAGEEHNVDAVKMDMDDWLSKEKTQIKLDQLQGNISADEADKLLNDLDKQYQDALNAAIPTAAPTEASSPTPGVEQVNGGAEKPSFWSGVREYAQSGWENVRANWMYYTTGAAALAASVVELKTSFARNRLVKLWAKKEEKLIKEYQDIYEEQSKLADNFVDNGELRPEFDADIEIKRSVRAAVKDELKAKMLDIQKMFGKSRAKEVSNKLGEKRIKAYADKIQDNLTMLYGLVDQYTNEKFNNPPKDENDIPHISSVVIKRILADKYTYVDFEDLDIKMIEETDKVFVKLQVTEATLVAEQHYQDNCRDKGIDPTLYNKIQGKVMSDVIYRLYKFADNKKDDEFFDDETMDLLMTTIESERNYMAEIEKMATGPSKATLTSKMILEKKSKELTDAVEHVWAMNNIGDKFFKVFHGDKFRVKKAKAALYVHGQENISIAYCTSKELLKGLDTTMLVNTLANDIVSNGDKTATKIWQPIFDKMEVIMQSSEDYKKINRLIGFADIKMELFEKILGGEIRYPNMYNVELAMKDICDQRAQELLDQASKWIADKKAKIANEIQSDYQTKYNLDRPRLNILYQYTDTLLEKFAFEDGEFLSSNPMKTAGFIGTTITGTDGISIEIMGEIEKKAIELAGMTTKKDTNQISDFMTDVDSVKSDALADIYKTQKVDSGLLAEEVIADEQGTLDDIYKTRPIPEEKKPADNEDDFWNNLYGNK
ncbi:hypothetical protein KJ855_01100 [Patescibacteria group bacterium]|nr:hypothetical protein [Patescibacteria group bacterium]